VPISGPAAAVTCSQCWLVSETFPDQLRIRLPSTAVWRVPNTSIRV